MFSEDPVIHAIFTRHLLFVEVEGSYILYLASSEVLSSLEVWKVGELCFSQDARVV